MSKKFQEEPQEPTNEAIPVDAIPAKTSPLDAKLEWCISKLLEATDKLDTMMQRGGYEYEDEEEEYEPPKPKKGKPKKKKKGRGKKLFQLLLIAVVLYALVMWGGEQMGWWTMNWYFF